jgi:peptide/nickel transport system ATP-binding protein
MTSTAAPHEPLIQAQSLVMDFWDEVDWVNIVNRASFSIQPGETLGLAGESGCGKTTVAGALMAYTRYGTRIREGQVLYGGHDLLTMSDRELCRIRGVEISMVPQNPGMALTPTMRVGDQVCEVLRVHGRSPGREKQRMLELFEHVQLPNPEEIFRRYPHQLSGGQQQRIVIALALSCKPQLVLLDEPTTDLDVTTQAQILELLKQLQAEHGMAMLYVTHNLGVLAQVTGNVAVMYAGELVELAPTREIYGVPLHPYTQGLIAAVPQIEASERSRVRLQGILRREVLPAGCRFAPRCQYAVPLCFQQPQILVEITPGHQVACHRWQEVAL